MVAKGMEVQLVDWTVMSVVVLNQLIVAGVPKFDSSVLASTCNTSSIWTELACVYCVLVIREADGNLRSLQIP